MRKRVSNPFMLALKAYNLSVEIHHHAAYQLVFSDDTPFQSTLDGARHERIHGFLIRPQIPHHCQAEKGSLSIFNIEPYSAIGRNLSNRFPAEAQYLVFPQPAELWNFFNLNTTAPGVQAVVDALVAMGTPEASDSRIAEIAEYIHDNYQETGITPRMLADRVFLSPSRLGALFKQQMGSSLSKYLLWTRLRQAIYRALSDREASLTTIAHDAGFYDLPQMNKYMYEMFGMPPKAVKYSSDLIQIY
ncbi:AraC-like DNA-binding protein [Neolewinella xylanilytica]|uniref:AraC-like DNA-binding protein n=1 Tax=Neolewinella xylanilytica TaxID=1514080 RepID=A0A2S6I5X4_9BACT|nr:AraC family transcriptional regulator [Neolewinella xylanilytica]PPK86564.1 AraC-like DNA-binding protein [Neolewinella xylanilytica]